MELSIEINLIRSDKLEELNQLISVFESVFEMEPLIRPSRSHLQKLLHKEDFFAVVAKANQQIVGGLTVYVLNQSYAEKPLAYIYDLAVLPEFQRKGLGKRLVEFTNDYCRERGFEEVFVQADKVDDYALDFYRSTAPTAEEEVIHFYYRLDREND
jgi:aminoglycoside 3-N-acetyltransferase I